MLSEAAGTAGARVKCLHTIAAALAAGLLLQLSFPPLHLGLLVLVAFAPALIVLRGHSGTHHLVAGFAIGLAWHFHLPLSLTAWGLRVATGGWLLCGILMAIIFLLHFHLQKKLSARLAWLSFPVCWTVVTQLATTQLHAPMALAPALAGGSPMLLKSAQLIGNSGLEFLLATHSAMLAFVASRVRQRGVPLAILAAPSALLATLATLAGWLTLPSSAPIPVYGVQPAFSDTDHRTAQWSLAMRKLQENRVDSLTQAALPYPPGLIVWPEGGNNLNNVRLQRRQHRIQDLFRQQDSVLLMAGNDIDPDGSKFNAVTLLDKNGIQGEARKSLTVPVAESRIAHGEPTVLHTRFASLGIAICYEALFAAHFDALVDQGADLLVTVSDDTSFGDGYLAEIHAAYALQRAITVARPLVFINNNGPSFIASSQGEITHADRYGRIPTLYRWQAETNRTSTVARQGGEGLFAVLISLLVMLAWQRTPAAAGTVRRQHYPLLSARSALALTLTVPTLALGSALATQAHLRGVSIPASVSEIWQRSYPAPARDGMSPIFTQSNKSSCGAAAMAFLLTRLGDEIYETDILTQFPVPRASGYNLEELSRMATNRGFSAQGFRAAWENLPTIYDLPVIAHWQRGHYVVVISRNDDGVLYFDPALGQTRHASRHAFEAEWSGTVLAVRTL